MGGFLAPIVSFADKTTAQRALQTRHCLVLPLIVLLMCLRMFEIVGVCLWNCLLVCMLAFEIVF
jgi:hypothetical protein